MHIHLNSKQTNRNKRNSLIKKKILTTPTHLYRRRSTLSKNRNLKGKQQRHVTNEFPWKTSARWEGGLRPPSPHVQIGFPFVRESPRFGQRCIPPSRFRISLYASKESRQTREERAAREARERRRRRERSRGKRRLAITGGGTSLFGSWEGEGGVVRGVSHGARANCSFIMHRNARNDATRVDSTL